MKFRTGNPDVFVHNLSGTPSAFNVGVEYIKFAPYGDDDLTDKFYFRVSEVHVHEPTGKVVCIKGYRNAERVVIRRNWAGHMELREWTSLLNAWVFHGTILKLGVKTRKRPLALQRMWDALDEAR